MKSPLIIDAFPAFNELRLAEFRIHYLSKFVDRVVIAEARLTQSGQPKPLYFKDWLSSKSLDRDSKVTVIEVPLSSEWTSWEREIFTREFLFKYIHANYPDSKFILSDLDEIPSTDQLNQLARSSGLFRFWTPTYYRKVNWQLKDQHFHWSRGVMGDTYLNTYANGGRFNKSLPIIDANAGAHFSWLAFDKDSLSMKSNAAAHAELNVSFWSNPKLAQYCDIYRIDHLGRSRSKGYGLLKIVNPPQNTILSEIAKFFPELFDDGVSCPSLLRRLVASIKVTTYLGNNKIAKRVRKRFSVDTFFSCNSFKIFSFIFLELLITLIYHLRQAIKDFRKSLSVRGPF